MGERGNLKFHAEGDASGFRQFMRQITQDAKHASGEVSKSWGMGSFGKSFVGGIAGALSFEAVKASLESFLDKAKEIRDLSEQMDMGTDATQRWAKAADHLGLSFGGMQSVLTNIAQKRQEAFTDPKAAELFTRLGIDRKTVLDTKNVDNSAFSEMVLNAGRQNDENRSTVGEIIGKRGLKYLPAAGEFAGASADIGDDALAVAKQAEDAKRTVVGWVGKFWNGLIVATKQLVDESADDKKLLKSHGKPGLEKNALPMTRTTPRNKGEPGEPDAAAEADKARQDAIQDRYDAAEERIEAAKRQNMTHAEKRASMEKTLADTEAKIESLKGRKAPASMKSQSEIDEFYVKNKEQIAAEEAKKQGLIADLREKPIDMPQNSLGKSGLFTASGLSGPGNVERDMLSELKQINRKIGEGPRDRL